MDDSVSLPFDGVHTKESTIRVTLNEPPRSPEPSRTSGRVTPSQLPQPILDNVLGNLSYTRWQPANALQPPGLGLKVIGVSTVEGQAVYEATLLGDAGAITGVLSTYADPPAEEAAAEEEADQAAAPTAIPISIVDAYGVEPLAHAAAAGHVAVVTVLLEAGVKVDATSSTDILTALHRAARSGRTDCCEMLIAKGAAVDAEAADMLTPLSLAVMGGHVDAVKALIAASANVSHADVTGITPLMQAAEDGNTEIAAALLEAGAALNATDENGWNALHYACAAGMQAAASLLAERGSSIAGCARPTHERSTSPVFFFHRSFPHASHRCSLPCLTLADISHNLIMFPCSTRGGRTLEQMNREVAAQLACEKAAREEQAKADQEAAEDGDE